MSAQDREAMAQVIANSFYAMQAGEFPDPALQPEPSAGDMQLASDLEEAGYALAPPISDEMADRANQALHEFMWGDEEPLSRRDLGIMRQSMKYALKTALEAS